MRMSDVIVYHHKKFDPDLIKNLFPDVTDEN